MSICTYIYYGPPDHRMTNFSSGSETFDQFNRKLEILTETIPPPHESGDAPLFPASSPDFFVPHLMEQKETNPDQIRSDNDIYVLITGRHANRKLGHLSPLSRHYFYV